MILEKFHLQIIVVTICIYIELFRFLAKKDVHCFISISPVHMLLIYVIRLYKSAIHFFIHRFGTRPMFPALF